MTDQATSERRASRRLSTLALAVGVVLVIGVALATAWLGWNDRASFVRNDREKAELLARLLEDQTTRTFESAFFVLSALGDSCLANEAVDNLRPCEQALRQALAGILFVRGLLVLDPDGWVLASSAHGEVGTQVDLLRLGPLPPEGRNAIGPLVAGRGVDVLDAKARSVAVPSGLGFVPLVRTSRLRSNQSVYLVALLNPDSLVNMQQLAIAQTGFDSAIATYRGAPVAGSSGLQWLSTDPRTLPVFRDFLPVHEHASYVGTGFGGADQIVAFRVSRSHPLVVLVEESRDAALSRWLTEAMGYLWVGFGACGLMLMLSLVAWRGLRLRESAQIFAEQAQARIVRSEHELAVLMSSVQEVIFRTDAGGCITFVNAHWKALGQSGGVSPMGRALSELVENDSRASVEALFADGASAGVRQGQATMRLGNGRRMRFDLAVVPLLDADCVVGFAGSAVDVTERWVAQRKLQSELEFRNLMLEMNPLPISMTDVGGRLVLVNRAWEEYKGRLRSDVLGLTLRDFLPAEEAAVHDAADRQLWEQGENVQFETRVLRGQHTWRDTRVTKAIVTDAEGSATGILCTLMDVSDFREAERVTREARDSAEEACRSKSEFVANMSHELRTPLQSIMGFSELGMLRSRAHPQLLDMFQDVHRAGGRMLSLVNDLLDVAKLESTVGTFHLERVDLRGVVRPVLRELEPLLAQRRLHLDVDLGTTPLMAKVDPVRFEQVVRNVMANAIKFSPQESQIQLRGRVDGGRQIQLSVRDFGPGIPRQELATIFEAFKQSSATNDNSGGTGLGLAICKKIVDALGGNIRAENAEPRGVVFFIEVPARSLETVPAEL